MFPGDALERWRARLAVVGDMDAAHEEDAGGGADEDALPEQEAGGEGGDIPPNSGDFQFLHEGERSRQGARPRSSHAKKGEAPQKPSKL